MRAQSTQGCQGSSAPLPQGLASKKVHGSVKTSSPLLQKPASRKAQVPRSVSSPRRSTATQAAPEGFKQQGLMGGNVRAGLEQHSEETSHQARRHEAEILQAKKEEERTQVLIANPAPSALRNMCVSTIVSLSYESGFAIFVTRMAAFETFWFVQLRRNIYSCISPSNILKLTVMLCLVLGAIYWLQDL